MNRVHRTTWDSFHRRAVFALGLLLPLGCQQEMGKQPSYRPLEPSAFFADGRSARPLPAGTVARGQLRDDLLLSEAREGGNRQLPPAVGIFGLATRGPLPAVAALEPLLQELALAEYAATFPFPVTMAVLERGRERYTIFYAVCHDLTGNGNGIIVQRGYTRPPSYITDESRGMQRRGTKVLLRDVPVGYYFGVVTKGYGAMPDYASQVPPRDRWAIVAYIRALQLSQYAPLQQLPQADREALQPVEGSP